MTVYTRKSVHPLFQGENHQECVIIKGRPSSFAASVPCTAEGAAIAAIRLHFSLRRAVAPATSIRQGGSSSGSGELLSTLVTRLRLFTWNMTVLQLLEPAKIKF